MTRCIHCGAEVTGRGGNNARLCVNCWGEILARVQAGETRKALAAEFGVSRQAVENKVVMYGGD